MKVIITTMNARDYKLFYPNGFYHIYNRGNNKDNIFLDDQDYLIFLQRIKIVLGIEPIPNAGRRGALQIRPFPKDAFTVLAYCLMPNHFHLLIRQNMEIKAGELMTKVCTSYAKYFNSKYNRIGNIFQDIFKAKRVDEDNYLSYLSAYIHKNPKQYFSYPYSSLQAYLKTNNFSICDPSFILDMFNSDKAAYRKFVSSFGSKETAKIKELLMED